MPVGLRLVAAVIVAGILAIPCAGLFAEDVDWATGPALKLQLADPVDIYWPKNPLREAISSLSQARRVAVLIDRRVDPGAELSVSLKAVPLESALQRVARGLGLGVFQLGDVLYLGPAAAADRLGAVSNEFKAKIHRLPVPVQRKYFQRKKMAWSDLAEPRELLAQLARQNDLTVGGLERIPHDLWAGADLPPLPLADRLTLIAFQFDLTYRISSAGQRLELVPLPKDIPAAAPERRAAAPLQPGKKPASTSPANIDQIRIDRLVVREKPLGPVLDQLAGRLGLDLRIDRKAIAAAGISLDQRVSLKVENATVDELLRQLLRGTRLTFHRRQRVVEIAPAG